MVRPDPNKLRKSMTLEESVKSIIRDAVHAHLPELEPDKVEQRVNRAYDDVTLLARAASTRCLITYASAISARGHGNPQNGQWLDNVFTYAILPFGFPDLTMLVVNSATKKPSPDAFDARRSKLSQVPVENIELEQKRCFWFEGYENILGKLEPLPKELHLVRIQTPPPFAELEISRAVSNALSRAASSGQVLTRSGKDYPGTLPRSELMVLTTMLWEEQEGRCALTGQKFDLRSNEDGGNQEDRVSLDRIDNSIGYAEGNIQLVTQFANRARGTMPIADARKRLVQVDY